MGEAANVVSLRNEPVAAEVALKDFERMCEARHVDYDEAVMTPTDQAQFQSYKRSILAAIRQGKIVVAQDGTATFNPTTGERTPLVFYPPTGATYMAMDQYPADQHMRRMVAALTEMTHSTKGEISKLEAHEFQVCTSLGNLFLSQR